MANVFQKGTKFAATALALLRREVKVPSIFTTRFTKADFAGAAGDTVMVRRPPLLVARDKGWRNDDAIVFDRLVNTKIPVVLDHHPYSAVQLSPEEETLDEIDYVRDVQAPQVQALVEWFENLVALALRGANYIMEVTYNPNAGVDTAAHAKQADPRQVASRARKLFQDKRVPASNRYWLVGSAVAEAIRDFGKLLDVDTAGIPEALREGVVTRLSGFTVVEVDAFTETESYFVHGSAIAIATVAPVVPQGVTKGGGVAADGGLALTQLWDYDSDHLKDRSIVHAFAGASLVTDPEIAADGSMVLDGDDPRLEFARAIKVIFIPVGGSDSGNGSDTYTAAITGTPTGGTVTLTVDGQATAPIAFNAANAAIEDALEKLSGVADVTVTGGVWPANTKTIVFKERVIMTGSGAGLTGGSTPSITVTAV
jgi:hypothetical protein